MELLCLNKKCNYNENCKCQNVYLYVECFRFEREGSKNIIEKYLKDENK
nr:MAG TPA: hypothetical protein [Caudoviricetes sp.]